MNLKKFASIKDKQGYGSLSLNSPFLESKISQGIAQWKLNSSVEHFVTSVVTDS